MQFSKVLIAVERPPLAFKVAEVGFSLAKSLAAQVMLVHVNASALLYSPDSGLSPQQLEARMTLEAEKLLQELVTLYGQDLEPLSFVLEGNTEEVILKTLHEIKPDLLVLGTHNHKPWRDLLLGSISEAIVRHANCPVMLVREGGE
jgi:nucleotide-binding universal stress UspA family protein